MNTSDSVIQHCCTFLADTDEKLAFDVVGMVTLVVLEAAVASLITDVSSDRETLLKRC